MNKKQELEMYFGEQWLLLWQNYKDEDYNGPVTSAGIDNVTKLQLLMDDTVDNVVMTPSNLIPWLKQVLPSKEQLSSLPNKEEADTLSVKTEQLLITVESLMENLTEDLP